MESDDFLGGLIHANEELVAALMAFEVLDKSVDDDSDSELEEAAHLSRTARAASICTSPPPAPTESIAGLSLQSPKMPARPSMGTIAMPRSEPQIRVGKGKAMRREPESESEEEDEDEDDDDENPFGDRNATAPPRTEKQGYTWKEV